MLDLTSFHWLDLAQNPHFGLERLSAIPHYQVWTNHISNGYHQGTSVLMAARRDWDGVFAELQCTKTMNRVVKVRTGRKAGIDRRNR
jgi:hypothetical protein